MNLTAEQSKAIAARGHVIVSAAAGSGKTFVMIERLVSLILGGADVRNVLAVTFTEKAAAQMRDRLRLALLERIGSTEGEERARLKEQLKALPLAQVSTVHAFCARLVRANFFVAGVDPAFRILSPEDAEGRVLRTRALDEVFERAYEEKDPAFSELLSVYYYKKKDARLRGYVLDIYSAVRGQSDYREQLEGMGRHELFDEACETVRADYARRASLVKERIDALLPFFEEGSRARLVADAVEEVCTKLISAPDLFVLAAEEVVIPRMPPKTKAEGEELARLNLLSGASEEVKKLARQAHAEIGTREREKELCEDAERRAAALSSLTLRFDEAYTLLKREANVLDYDDLEHFALKVLQNEEARREARERYRYLFVDEFQDVNPVQDSILSLLAGEEVFFVGDGKQAIYAFRGSNSEFFARKAAELGPLELSENFRSARAVLELTNAVFAPHIQGYVPMRGGARYGEHLGETVFWRVPKEKAERPERGVYSVAAASQAKEEDALAAKIASVVEEELTRTFFDADAGAERRVRFGDIAVLTRKNSGVAERVVRALEARDIPVTTTSKVNVCDFFEARLLIDALSYLDNPEQDIPLAGLMLSAVGEFGEEELARIRLDEPSAYFFRTACKKRAERGDVLGEKLRAFFAKCEAFRSYALVHTAAETADVLLASGLEAQIASKREGELRLARVRRLLSEAEDCPCVHAFLARLKATGYCVDYAGGGAESAVKVLTMHASKGLEYPVVLLAGLDVLFHGADREEIVRTERFGIAPRSYDTEKRVVYENMLRRASAVVQEQEELVGERNLLYVAMTRARYRLHLFLEGAERAPFVCRRFADFLEPFARYEKEEACAKEALPRTVLPASSGEEESGRVRAVYRMAYPYTETVPLKSSATDLLRGEEDGYERDEGAKGTFSAEKGTAYHAFLEHVRFGRDVKEELARMEREGLLTGEQLALLNEEELRAILSLPCMQLSGKKLYREQKFLLLLPARDILPGDAGDEVVFQGAIDLLVEEEGRYRIVDYKYSSRSDESARRHYAVQIALYRKAVARAKGVPEEEIGASIVNIALLHEIPM